AFSIGSCQALGETSLLKSLGPSIHFDAMSATRRSVSLRRSQEKDGATGECDAFPSWVRSGRVTRHPETGPIPALRARSPVLGDLAGLLLCKAPSLRRFTL